MSGHETKMHYAGNCCFFFALVTVIFIGHSVTNTARKQHGDKHGV